MKVSAALSVIMLLGALGPLGLARASTEGDAELMALERDSHQRWLEGDVAALDALMDEQFHFVVMNGAVETKEEIVGREVSAAPRQRPLQVRSLRVDPERVLRHDNTAIVLSTLHIDATARGRQLPGEMRILSVFQQRGGDGWSLIARSITPILAPPEPAAQ